MAQAARDREDFTHPEKIYKDLLWYSGNGKREIHEIEFLDLAVFWSNTAGTIQAHC